MSYSVNQLESKNKQKVRQTIIDTVKKEFKNQYSVRGLSLPNLNFTIETELTKSFKLGVVDCIEHDVKVYNRQLALPISNKMFFHNTDVFTWLRITPMKYDWMFIDLCGSLQLRVKNNLISLIQSDKLKDNCIIALTLLKGREYDSSAIKQSTGKSMEYYRTEGLVEDLNFFASQVNRKVKLLKEINYSSELPEMVGKKASPMKVLILKITKNK